MRKILVTGDFDIDPAVFPPGVELIHLRKFSDESQLVDVLPEIHDYILGGPEYVSKKLIDRAVMLENLVVMGTGTSSFVDIDYAASRGVRIINTPKMNTKAVTEFTMAMITNCLSGLFESIAGVREGSQWLQTPRAPLSDVKFGVLGMGAIGEDLVRSLRDRGCNQLSYWSRTRKAELESSLNLKWTSVSNMVREADILCVHLTYSPETHHLLNETLLNMARPELKILNLSNPHIIDPKALRGFLCQNDKSFCLIDGYYNEWFQNKGQTNDPYELLSLSPKNFVATSHVAAQESSVVRAIFERAVDILKESRL